MANFPFVNGLATQFNSVIYLQQFSLLEPLGYFKFSLMLLGLFSKGYSM